MLTGEKFDGGDGVTAVSAPPASVSFFSRNTAESNVCSDGDNPWSAGAELPPEAPEMGGEGGGDGDGGDLASDDGAEGAEGRIDAGSAVATEGVACDALHVKLGIETKN